MNEGVSVVEKNSADQVCPSSKSRDSSLREWAATVVCPSRSNSMMEARLFRDAEQLSIMLQGHCRYSKIAYHENAEKPTFNRPRIARLPSWKEIPDSKSPIVSPDSRSKHMISKPGYSTPIPMGNARGIEDCKTPDNKPVSRKTNPKQGSDIKRISKIS